MIIAVTDSNPFLWFNLLKMMHPEVHQTIMGQATKSLFSSNDLFIIPWSFARSFI